MDCHCLSTPSVKIDDWASQVSGVLELSYQLKVFKPKKFITHLTGGAKMELNPLNKTF